MKRSKTPRSFEELIGTYYGAGGDRAPIATRAEELFASHYGTAVARKRGAVPDRVTQSLSFDTHETLAQRPGRDRGGDSEEYVPVGYGMSEDYEEYVVPTAGALTQSMSGGMKAAVVTPSEELNPSQEYLVDVLDPFAPAPASETVVRPERTDTRPRMALGSEHERDGVIAQSSSAAAGETSQAQANDDDFMADMKSILTGQKVYDPTSGRTMERGKLDRSPTGAPQRRHAEPQLPEASNAQSIFDRIAQSMELATAYDMGTMELNKRFSDFDKLAELQQQAAERKRLRKHEAAAAPLSTGALASTAEFVEDLEVIRRGGSGSNPPEARPPHQETQGETSSETPEPKG